VVEASHLVHPKVPIVVRLEGTNAEEAGVILKNSGLNFLVAKGMTDAAKKVTQALAA
jgi:succinyl-CoA synthetase beta subunit